MLPLLIGTFSFVPMAAEDAIAEIRRNLGTQFDPQMGQVFIQPVENGTISIQRYSTP
ncbi:MAG: hypothetical protein ACI3W8_03790 [Oscillospiraceae bacterium]